MLGQQSARPSFQLVEHHGGVQTESLLADYDGSHNYLEEEEEPRSCWRRIDWSFWFVILAVLSVLLVAESSRGMVIPSLWLYIQKLEGNKQSLGIAVGVYSVGRLLGSIIFGYWYNKRGAKETLLVSLLLSIVGNIMYSLAEETGLWMIMLSRGIVGLATGVVSVVRAVIADVTTTRERTRYLAASSAVQYIGFGLMPGVGGVLAELNFRVFTLPIDQYTASGYILAAESLLLFLVILFALSPLKPGFLGKKESSKVEEYAAEHIPWLLHLGVAVFIGLNFISRGVLALIETAGSPMFVDVWNDQDSDVVQDQGEAFTILGALSLVTFVAIDVLRRWIPEYILLSSSFLILSTGSLCLIDYGPEITLVQFFAGLGLIWSIASPAVQTLILSAFSKILGSRPQGGMMGWIASAGSVGRIVFPFMSGFLGHNISFVVSAVTCCVCSAVVLAYKWKLERAKRRILIEEEVWS